MQVAIDYHPFAKGATLWNCVCVVYLSIFSLYWLYSLCHAVRDIHAASDIKHFTTHKLGLSESQLKTVTWPEVAKRIVNVSHAFTCAFRSICSTGKKLRAFHLLMSQLLYLMSEWLLG